MSQKEYITRAYSPLGLYHCNIFKTSDSIFVLDDDLFFSLTRFHGESPDDFYFERRWIYPNEIRLLASIALSVPYNSGKVYSYPDPGAYRIMLDEDEDVQDENVIRRLKDFLVKNINGRNNEFYVTVPPAPIFGGPSYTKNEGVCDIDLQYELFSKIDLTDPLLIRGLGALLKGDLLNKHHIFHTEACISLHIAMEASMHIIFRKLSKEIEKPSPKDASAYISDIFETPNPPDKYFEAFYEDRIKAIHPANRYGTYPYAPLAADDFYILYKDLKSVYLYLITEKINSGW
jgi:hypothetical protein